MRIETERLLLRQLGLADLDDFVALHDDPDVTRFIRRLERPEAEERLRLVEREWLERGHGMFAVLEVLSGRFLGRAGLKYWPQFDETEVGWVLRRDAWGYGYATEAARACIDWGFASLAVPYLTAMIHPENEASIRLAGRLGMSPLRPDVLLGEPVVVYSLRRSDWMTRKGASPSDERAGEVRQVIEKIRRWARGRRDVRALALVGSWARGPNRPDSDVDLVVLHRLSRDLHR